MNKHVWYECPSDCNGCHYCLGGLSTCTVCKASEGELPSECPGTLMTEKQKSQVDDGWLDFQAGKWVHTPD